MMTYKTIQAALDEIKEAYDREITKWYRIRRRALARGLTNLAADILTEIATAQRDINYMDFRNFDFQHKYLFQMDRPAHHYRDPFQTGCYPGCYGDAEDDC